MNLQKLAIYGAGGLGKEIAWMVQDINAQERRWEIIGFFDDGLKRNTVVDGQPVLGGLDELNASTSPLQIVVAIADPKTKRNLVGKIASTHIEFPVLIHPSCILGNVKANQFGRGTILTAGVILTTHIKIGEFVLINLAATVGHDAGIGNFSTIMPGCSISGNVKLGDGCMMGTGARTLQNITIGPDSVIGAGAVVTKSFAGKARLLGVPAINTL